MQQFLAHRATGIGTAKARNQISEPDLRGRRVLVVDDNERARLVLNDLLTSMTFHVTEVGAGKTAIEAVKDKAGTPETFAVIGAGHGAFYVAESAGRFNLLAAFRCARWKADHNFLRKTGRLRPASAITPRKRIGFPVSQRSARQRAKRPFTGWHSAWARGRVLVVVMHGYREVMSVRRSCLSVGRYR